MNCLELLRISARLLDLHDAERIPGNSPVFSQEERRGLRDGRYVDLAGAILEILRLNAHSSGNAFMGFDALLIEVRQERPEVDADDVRYVLNVLARPTELWTLERGSGVPRLVSDKASDLVEKTYFAEDYRLAPAGRAAIAIASNIQSFAYAEGDVLKLLRAIEAGDFTLVPVFCKAILDSIRYESVDLRTVIEKGAIDRESALYKDQLPRYRQVIKQSSDLLRQADAKLKGLRASENEALDEALPIDVYEVEQYLLQVYQALESFGRELSELTSMAAQRRGTAVDPPDFLNAALSLVKTPASHKQTTYLLRQFGPLSTNGIYPSPMDTMGKVRIPLAKISNTTDFETDGASPIAQEAQLLFLDEFGPAMRDRLSQGPLSVTEALERGWCEMAGRPALGELLSVYIAPWSLDPLQTIGIAIPSSFAAHRHSALGDVFLNDLELSIHKEEGAA